MTINHRRQVSINSVRKEQIVSNKNANRLGSLIPTTQQVEDIFADLVRVGDLDVYHARLLAVDCGLRRGEIVELRPTQLDFNDGIIKLYPPKTSRPRIVYMTERVRRELRGRWPVVGTDAYAFLPHHYRPAAARKLEIGLRKAASRLNIAISFASLRWKYTADLPNAGVSVCDLSKALGHRRHDCALAYCRSC